MGVERVPKNLQSVDLKDEVGKGTTSEKSCVVSITRNLTPCLPHFIEESSFGRLSRGGVSLTFGSRIMCWIGGNTI